METKHIVAERIRQRRTQKGYSQEFLAESASISVRTLQRIEGGQTEPRGHTLIALARALDMPVEDLMDFTKKENNSILHAINLSALAYWSGKRQVLIQLVWTVLMFLGIAIFFIGPFLGREEILPYGILSFPPFMILMVYVLNAAYIIFVSFMISKERQIPFLGIE